MEERERCEYARNCFINVFGEEVINDSRIQQLCDFIRRFEYTIEMQTQVILQAIATMFGVDFPTDTDRWQYTISHIIPTIKQTNFLDEVLTLLKDYQLWSATGAHRYIPVALFIDNVINKRAMFSFNQFLTCKSREEFVHSSVEAYLQLHPYPKEGPILPSPKASEISGKKYYSVLDIGSAPKNNGAPTLNLLRDFHQQSDYSLSISGLEVLFPRYYLQESDHPADNNNNRNNVGGEIKSSVYFDEFGKVKSGLNVGGIFYLNGNELYQNIMEDLFLPSQQYHFITVCTVFYHFLGDKPAQLLPLSNRYFISSNQQLYKLTPTQQEVIDRLLDRLYVNGVLLLNLDQTEVNNPLLIQPSFLIIQKLSDNLIHILPDFPLFFSRKPFLNL